MSSMRMQAFGPDAILTAFTLTRWMTPVQCMSIPKVKKNKITFAVALRSRGGENNLAQQRHYRMNNLQRVFVVLVPPHLSSGTGRVMRPH